MMFLCRVIWYNRVQNRMVLALCKEGSKEWTCKTIFREYQPDGWLAGVGWGLKPLKTKGDFFLKIIPSLQPKSKRHYRHIAKIDFLNRSK